MNVDIVFVIDVTGSMRGTIDAVKNAALTFHDGLCDKLKDFHKTVKHLRVKVVWFRDYYADENNSCGESEFMELPAQAADFRSFVSGLEATGGGDTPETSLEALTLAMRSDFVQDGDRKRHIILLFTDAPAHAFEERDALTRAAEEAGRRVYYPDNMPSSLREFVNAWEGNVKAQAMLGANRKSTKLDAKGRRMVLFAPRSAYPWNELVDKIHYVWGFDLPVESSPDMSAVYRLLAASASTN